jgi:hypothetical protein
MPRRRTRVSFDARALPLILGLLILWFAYRTPGFAITVCVAFAAVAASIWLLGSKRRIRELHQWGAVSNMYTLSPEAFEAHVAGTYEALGYKTTVTRRIGDQGLDVLAVRGQERIGVQCKRTTEAVSNSAVQEAYAGKAHYQCSSAAVVALGGFTTGARSLAATTGVSLFDGSAYADLFHRATATLPNRSVWNVLPTPRARMRALICASISAVTIVVGIAGITSRP